MKTISKRVIFNPIQLWRVEWNHRSGYNAPSTFVEAKTKQEAIQLAKKESRLGDFPEQWSVTPRALYELDSKGKKKLVRKEYDSFD